MRTHSFWSRATEDFIIGSSLLSLLGWSLALTQLLRPIPYAIGLVVCVAIFLWVRRWLPGETSAGRPQRGFRRELQRVRRRLRKPIFIAYGAILLAAIVGGSLYLPSNYDALSYRTPQLLHWLDHGGWHWITTPNSRMNIASPGFNWLTAPFVIFAHTDHLSFLANIAAFALFPGCLFEMFSRAGISSRVAWWWIWLIPTGYVFATQAGSVGNDLTGAVFAVASIALALRARDTGQFCDGGLSLVAVALCTGIKNTNLPILLPWAIALGSGWRCFLSNWLAAIAVAMVAAAASCLPTTILNIRQTGHWTGDPKDEHRVHQPNSWVGLVSNAVSLTVANLQPPLWPTAQRTNERLAQAIDQSWLGPICRRSPRFEAKWYELPSEENAGFGLGMTVLVAAGVTASVCRRAHHGSAGGLRNSARAIGLASLSALLVPIALISSEGLPRLSAPFVPSALALILGFRVDSSMLRSVQWKAIALVTGLFPISALVLSPARPLFPRHMISERNSSSNSGIGRIYRVYSIYADRPDAFAPVRALIPKDTRTIGLIAFGDEPETSLWRPFGSVSVRHVMKPIDLAGIETVVASDLICRSRFGCSAAEFAASQQFTLRGESEVSLRVSGASETWFVMERAE